MKKHIFLLIAVLFAIFHIMGAYATRFYSIDPVPSRTSALGIDLWTDKGEGAIYHEGETIEIFFRASDDCYLALYSIATDGSVRLIFPKYPDDGFIFGGMTYKLPDYYDPVRLRISGPRGVEYLHAVATRHPNLFRYRTYRGTYFIDVDPICDDPFVAINRINARIITPHHIHATATVSFFVGGFVWYPRYLCNSCHYPARKRFDPYRDVCPRYHVALAHNYDYWWAYNYHPSIIRFAFIGPFWRFEIRTTPLYRHRKIRYIDCAYGYHNYHPIQPLLRSHVYFEHKSPRTSVYREYERSYTPVTFEDIRTRRTGSTRTREIITPTRSGARTESSTDQKNRSRSPDITPSLEGSHERAGSVRIENTQQSRSSERSTYDLSSERELRTYGKESPARPAQELRDRNSDTRSTHVRGNESDIRKIDKLPGREPRDSHVRTRERQSSDPNRSSEEDRTSRSR